MIHGIFTAFQMTAADISDGAIIMGSGGAPVEIRRAAHQQDNKTITFMDVRRGKLFRFRKDQPVTVLLQEDENDPIVQAEVTCALAAKGVQF